MEDSKKATNIIMNQPCHLPRLNSCVLSVFHQGRCPSDVTYDGTIFLVWRNPVHRDHLKLPPSQKKTWSERCWARS